MRMTRKAIFLGLPLLLAACDSVDAGKWTQQGNECVLTTADNKLSVHVLPSNRMYFIDLSEDCSAFDGGGNDAFSENPVKIGDKTYSAGFYCKAHVRYPAIRMDREEDEREAVSNMLKNDRVKIDIYANGKEVHTLSTKGLTETCQALFSYNPIID